MDQLLAGVDDGGGRAVAATAAPDAAEAIMTTDTVPKTAVVDGDGWTVGGMAKGAGMLAPGLATMLVRRSPPTPSSTPPTLDAALRAATRHDLRPGRLRRLHVHQRHRAAAGQRRVRRRRPTHAELAAAVDRGLRRPGPAAGRRRRGRDQGHRDRGASARRPRTTRSRSAARSPAATCSSARSTARTPTGAAILAAVGTTAAAFDPTTLDVAINGVWVCRGGAPGEDRDQGRPVRPRRARSPSTCTPATATATVWTNDLTAAYVHENSAYST